MEQEDELKMASQDTICNLCFNTFEEPMLLSCGHNLCKKCVARAESLYAAYKALEPPTKKKSEGETSEPSVACPLCGKVTPVVQCKPNMTLRNIMSLSNNSAVLELPGADAAEAETKTDVPVCGFCKKPATVFCAFCGPLCEEHSDFLHVKGPMHAHELSKTPVEVMRSIKEVAAAAGADEGEGSLVLPLCKDHGKQMELFCSKCETLVCAHCVLIGDHKGHECMSVLAAFAKTNQRIDELLKEIKEKAPKCKELEEGYEKLRAGAEAELKEARELVQKTFDDFRKMLDENQKATEKEMEDVFTSFTSSVSARTAGLEALAKECELVQQSSETTAAKNDLVRYTLFKSLKNLADHLGSIASTQVPDDAKICMVDPNKSLLDAKKLSVVKVRPMFRFGCGRVIYYNLDWDRLEGTRNVASEIRAGNSTSHDGGAIYDPVRRMIVAVSGNYNNGRNVLVTRLTDDTHGETTAMTDLVPFGTHGQYPVFDGRQYTYFFQSEHEDNNRMGRIDMDTLAFEALPSLPGGSFREFCSGCAHNGSIYVLDRDLALREFNPDTNTWTTLPITMPRPGRLLDDPANPANIYCLCCDGRGLIRIDLDAQSHAAVTDTPSNFSLGANGEAALVRVTPTDFFLFACLSSGWRVYSSERNTWASLRNWRSTRNGSGHLVISPDGPYAFYHVDDSDTWDMVDLRA